MLTDSDLRKLERNLHTLDPVQKARVLQLLEERDSLKRKNEAREHFLPFVKKMWPDFIEGAHHVIMAEAFEKVARGEIKRLCISIAPRHGKSELTSFLLPAWFLGKFPRKKIIQVSNTEGLASGFGRRVRNLINDEPAYHEVFPGVALAKDSQAAAEWHTNVGGEYYAVGVRGKLAGRGADIAIVDDPHSEQEAKMAESNPAIFDDVVEWYSSGIRQRLQPGGAIVIVMTRWSKRDLIGQVLKRMQEDEAGAKKGTYDEWTVINLPAILDEDSDTERPLWPGFWTLDELKATKKAVGPVKWAAQYAQNPTGSASAIFRKENWRRWSDPNEQCPDPQLQHAWNNEQPPPCSYIIHSWDTAMRKNERADYSAFTSWGVFETSVPEEVFDEDGKVVPIRRYKTVNNIILLSAWKSRIDFPELKRKVKQYYDEDKPDTLLIEDKGSGISLIQELRATGTPVENFSYGRGSVNDPNNKIVRANLITDIFASGYVWAPLNRFAEDVIAECSDFPAGEHDDLVDSTVQAMIRFRTGGLVRTASDEPDDESFKRFRRKVRYY